MVIHQGILSKIESETIAVPSINLSATGSKNFPSSVTAPRLRASFPSKMSESPRMKNIVHAMYCHMGSSPPFLNNA